MTLVNAFHTAAVALKKQILIPFVSSYSNSLPALPVSLKYEASQCYSRRYVLICNLGLG